MSSYPIISLGLVSSHLFNRIPSHCIISYCIISHHLILHVLSFSTVIPLLQPSEKPLPHCIAFVQPPWASSIGLKCIESCFTSKANLGVSIVDMSLPRFIVLAIACSCKSQAGSENISSSSCTDSIANSACDEPSLVQLGVKDAKDANDAKGEANDRDSSQRRKRRASTYTGTLPYVLQAYCSSGTWLTACDDIPRGWKQHVGAFDKSISTTPPAATGSASDNYITLGGSGVEGDVPSASTIEGWFSSSNANNLDFDLQGVLNGGFCTASTLTETIQKTYPDAKSQVTCLVGTYSTAATYADTFDYFGIMIHGDSMTSGKYSIPEEYPTSGGTWPYIKDWIDSDVPNSKIILSLTTNGLEAYMVDWFKALIAEYGLAGMSFWDWNQLDDSISTTCIEDQRTQCDSSDPFKCSAVCNGGDADGQCCDSVDITTVGSCKTLGQEGCCGGTESTTYCQLVS